MTRDRFASSLLRYFKWQLASRVAPGDIVVPYVNDARLVIPTRRSGGGRGAVYAGLTEFEDMAFVLHFFRPDDLFVDVGANIGAYTVLAGKAVGARCISFEPVPDTYQALLDNVLLNRISERVQTRNCAAAGSAGEIEFQTGSGGLDHVVRSDDDTSSGKTTRVPTVRLDDSLEGETPIGLKVDVEGYETEVVAGAPTTLARPELQVVLMEMTGLGARYGFDEARLQAQLIENGLKPYSYDPFSRELTDCQNGDPQGRNQVYLRDIDVAQERVRSAPAFTALGRKI